MARTYIAYVNDKKAGLTWGALAGASLIILGKACSPIEVALHIWGKDNPPVDLRGRVQTALTQMVERGFVTQLSRASYRITLLGQHVFGAHLDADANLRRMSDSVLFNPERTNRKKYNTKKKRKTA